MSERDQLEEALETIRQLRDLLFAEEDSAFVHACRRVLGIRPSAAAVLKAIAHRRQIRAESLFVMLYGDRPNPPSEVIVKVHVSYLRKALTPHGIAIQTLWGSGYVIDDDSRARLVALLGCDTQPPKALSCLAS